MERENAMPEKPHDGPGGFSAADMATASAQGFRDGVAAQVAALTAAPGVQADWTQPTTVAQRLGDAVQLLCGGKRPPEAMVTGWLDHSSEELQSFCAEHGPSWAQGIGLIDAAMVMVDQPTEITTIEHPDRDHEHRAPAQPAEGAAYAELPEPDATTVGLGAVWNRHSMRDFADRTHALRASLGQAPAGATDPQLLKFYGVNTDAELIAAQAGHIERLQAKLPQTPSLAPQRVREG